MTPGRLLSKLLCTLVFAATISVAFAQTTAPGPRPANAAEIELNRKLDGTFTLSLQKVELSEAFKQIAANAQVSLQVDPACYDALPYGASTHVTVEFRDSKLRDCIEQVLEPLCLEQVISGSSITIRPTGPLARIGHRAAWDELKLLQELRTAPDLKAPAGAAGGGAFEWTAALRAVLDHPRLTVSIAGGGGNGPDAAALHDKALDQLKKQFPISPFRALEFYARLTNQVWFVEAGPGSNSGGPGGGTVLIMPMRKWIERQLQRPVKMDLTNAPVQQIFEEISHISGIRFTPEPGLYQTAPPMSVKSNNYTVEDLLKTIAGSNASIAYELRDDSIYLHSSGTASAKAPRVDPIVGRIAVPLGNPAGSLSMDMLIHESDLPPELNDLRKKKLQEVIDALQKSWTPAPATNSTTPATTTAPATVPEPK